MLARALVVLLLVLNLGVALWWMTRPSPAPAALPSSPPGVPPLRLLAEAPALPSAATAAAPVQPRTVAPMRCYALGPYAAEAEAAASRAALLGWGATRVRVRAEPGATRGWNVALPPLADQAAAEATATRIREAGFEDLLVMPADGGRYAIALGRYGSEASARQRVASLRAAGFEAQANPIADPASTRWLDIALPGDRDVAEARRVGGAGSAEAVACDAPGEGPGVAPR